MSHAEMRMRRYAKFRFLLPFATTCIGILIYLWQPASLSSLRNATFDQYQRWQPRVYEDSRVRVIDIDDETLRRFGQWPWPRTLEAELISRLQKAGAAAIGLDFIFAEPDRTSPRSMAELWHPPETIRRQLDDLPDPDAVFAETMGHGKVVLGFAVEQGNVRGTTPEIKAGYGKDADSAPALVRDYSGTVPSLPLLQDAAEGNGALAFTPDVDGVIRRAPLIVRQGSKLLPTFSAELLRVASGEKDYALQRAPGQSAGVAEVHIGKLRIPTTEKGEIWLHYTKPEAARTIPAWKVLAGEVSAGQLANQILLIGTSAKGLMDIRFIPMGMGIPGVEIHAQAIEQILAGSTFTRPSWAGALELLTIAGGGMVVGIVALSAGPLLSSALFLLLLVILWGLAWRAFSLHGILIDPVVPTLALTLTFFASGIMRHIATEMRQRWVKAAFSHYVSPNLVSHLVDHPEALELGGRRQQCSFIFTDLVGYTTVIENMDPGDAVALLNAYLDQMIAIAFSHQGTLDRIVGDAVAIMFSAPVIQPDHQRRALTCALEMQRFATKYADDLNARGIPFGRTRIGVHSGEVIVGNFGGETMFDYRALGDPVNTASRLESVNKMLGTLICVSEATLSGCPEIPARPIGRLLLKGKERPLMVYEPVDPLVFAKEDTDYAHAYQLLRDEKPEAQEAFERLAAMRDNDPLVNLHLGRLRAGITGDLVITERRVRKSSVTFNG